MIAFVVCSYYYQLLNGLYYDLLDGGSSTRRMNMAGDMKILIHGTKNAYTTLRPYDLIQYKLEKGDEIEGCSKRIGLFDGLLIHPMCGKLESDSSVMVADPSVEPTRAEVLKQKGLLMNIVSSSRRGNSYLVEEYIDDSVYIPLLTDIIDSTTSPCDDDVVPINENRDNTVQPMDDIINDVDIEIAETKVEIARLELRLLKLERSKQTRSGSSV